MKSDFFLKQLLLFLVIFFTSGSICYSAEALSYKCCSLAGAYDCSSGYRKVQQLAHSFGDTVDAETNCRGFNLPKFITSDGKVHIIPPAHYKCCTAEPGAYACQNGFKDVQQLARAFNSYESSAKDCEEINISKYMTEDGNVHDVKPKDFKCCNDVRGAYDCKNGYQQVQQVTHQFTSRAVALRSCQNLNLNFVITNDDRIISKPPQFHQGKPALLNSSDGVR